MKPLNGYMNSVERFWYDGDLIWEIDSDHSMPIEISQFKASAAALRK